MRPLLSLLVAVALTAAAPSAAAPVQRAEVVAVHPHDPDAFTQGLFFVDGRLFESTGQWGESSVREVRLKDGRVLRRVALPAQVFGEGSVNWKDRLLVLTWTHGVGFILGLDDFAARGRFAYAGEGWGLTQDGRRLILSDGTPTLRFLDPETLKETDRLRVTDAGAPVANLNELEYVRGEIWANVWTTDRIARIDPRTGVVKGWIDLTGLLPAADVVPGRTDVLNGIAYDAKSDRIYVTGKRWPKLFEIRVKR